MAAKWGTFAPKIQVPKMEESSPIQAVWVTAYRTGSPTSPRQPHYYDYTLDMQSITRIPKDTQKGIHFWNFQSSYLDTLSKLHRNSQVKKVGMKPSREWWNLERQGSEDVAWLQQKTWVRLSSFNCWGKVTGSVKKKHIFETNALEKKVFHFAQYELYVYVYIY